MGLAGTGYPYGHRAMAENWVSVRVDEKVAAAEAAAADVLPGVQLPAPEKSAQEKRPVVRCCRWTLAAGSFARDHAA